MDFRFAFRRYSLGFTRPVRTSAGTWAARQGVYVRLERPDGSVGYGEAAPVPFFGGESTEEIEVACRAFGDHVSLDALSQVPKGLGSLRFALGCAVGGAPGSQRHTSLGVAALLPAGRAALVDAPSKAEAGFRVFKWKVGIGAADDEMAILDDLLGRLPAGSMVRLDANGAWDRRTAGKWLAYSSDRPVEYVEQPLAPDSRGIEDSLTGLAADYPVPMALDESIAREGDAERWLDLGWRGFFVIKPSLTGNADKAFSRLSAAHAKVVFSSALETGMGAQAALRLAFAWPGKLPALGFGVWPLFTDPAFDGPPAAPFIRLEDVDRISPEALWNAAS
jgi:O-succinylbenzoate synthase